LILRAGALVQDGAKNKILSKVMEAKAYEEQINEESEMDRISGIVDGCSLDDSHEQSWGGYFHRHQPKRQWGRLFEAGDHRC
jgi:hypothetical protein